MRGFLRVVLGTVAIVAVVGAALRATGVWQWIDAQITVQFEGPTGRAGRSVEPVGWRVFGDHQLRWESVTTGVKT